MATRTINQVEVLTSLHNLMGHRNMPGGQDEDLKRYIQHAFNYAWRYYKWTFSLNQATLSVDEESGYTYMPEDFDIEGFRAFSDATEIDLTELPNSTGSSNFALLYDMDANRYRASSNIGGVITYQTVPPTLSSDVNVPFPAVQTIAVGAIIWAKQADNPTRADVSQEWDEFHNELDRHVARAASNQPRRRARNYHDVNGGGTGYVG